MPVIEVQNLRKAYRDQVAVHDVSLSVDKGEIFGICGRNGAGKTTTVECIGGLRSADGGAISVLGLDPVRDRTELRRAVGIQLQASELPEKLRVGEAVELFAAFYPDPADPNELIERWGLSEKRKSAFGKLSGGQKQRLSIVLALVGNPRVAILDELTTGLDPQARRDTWASIEQIRAAGVTVVLVTHFMEEAERLCDRIAIVDAGRVIATDTPDGLVRSLPDGQRLRFRPSAEFPDELLTDLPEVHAVQRTRGAVEVSGHGDLLQVVTSALAARRVVAVDLRLDQPTLDDAFVALTGRSAASE
jgi:ABC-2 type transport system ATP-binding protein